MKGAPKSPFWKAIIVAEAATIFRRNGRNSIERRKPSLEEAKAWVEAEVRALLNEEEEISMAMVARGEESFELCPSSWGAAPLWRDVP